MQIYTKEEIWQAHELGMLRWVAQEKSLTGRQKPEGMSNIIWSTVCQHRATGITKPARKGGRGSQTWLSSLFLREPAAALPLSSSPTLELH